MTRDKIIEIVGNDNYLAACKLAVQEATRKDFGRGSGGDTTDVPHEIEALIWDSPISWIERIQLFFSVFDDMPHYGHLMYLSHHFEEFDLQSKTLWWQEVRKRLAGNDLAIKNEIKYSLWCDFFEKRERVQESWEQICVLEPDENIIRTVLSCSGPVPFEWKNKIYEKYLSDKDWHPIIFWSLYTSTFDYLGNVNATKAIEILNKLQLPSDLPKGELLRNLIQLSQPV